MPITLTLLTLFTLSASANFTEQEIQPFLGPYKVIEKGSLKTCPKGLNLFAHCSLGQLSLNHVNNPQFIFKEFLSIDKGNRVTKEGEKVISQYEAKFSDKTLKVNEKIFFNPDRAITEKTLLQLRGDNMNISVSQVDSNKTVEILKCSYQKDTEALAKMMKEFCQKNPKAFDCKK